MANGEGEGAAGAEVITLRYRLTPALARRWFWYAMGEWAPVLAGLGLLTLVCASWSPLGQAGRVAAILAPAAGVFIVLWYLSGVMKQVESYRGRDIVAAFHRQGLRVDIGLDRSEVAWASLRHITRRRWFWLAQFRTGSRFLVPTDELTAEAAAAIAGWASAAGVRLT